MVLPVSAPPTLLRISCFMQQQFCEEWKYSFQLLHASPTRHNELHRHPIYAYSDWFQGLCHAHDSVKQAAEGTIALAVCSQGPDQLLYHLLPCGSCPLTICCLCHCLTSDAMHQVRSGFNILSFSLNVGPMLYIVACWQSLPVLSANEL